LVMIMARVRKSKMPAIFVGHGSPMVALEEDSYTKSLASFAKMLPKPKAIAVVSAHWESKLPWRVTAGSKPGIIYDFFGFPDELYRLTYPCPGDPALAREIADLLSRTGEETVLDSRRGIDHGAWVPIRRMFPQADIPVVQISLPPSPPLDLVRMGQFLAPLRSEGVLLMGSGNLVHNLKLIHFEDKNFPVESWAGEFDSWLAEMLGKFELQQLIDYRHKGPHAAMAAPTTEHFDPLFFVLGAAEGEPLTAIFAGFHHGNISMRTLALGV